MSEKTAKIMKKTKMWALSKIRWFYYGRWLLWVVSTTEANGFVRKESFNTFFIPTKSNFKAEERENILFLKSHRFYHVDARQNASTFQCRSHIKQLIISLNGSCPRWFENIQQAENNQQRGERAIQLGLVQYSTTGLVHWKMLFMLCRVVKVAFRCILNQHFLMSRSA